MFQHSRFERGLGLDLIRIVSGRKDQERDGNKGQGGGISVQLRIVNCSGELRAHAVDLVQYRDHGLLPSLRGQSGANRAKLWRGRMAERRQDSCPRAFTLFVRVLPLQTMFPSQQIGIGCDEHGLMGDCCCGDHAIRGIAMKTLEFARKDSDVPGER